MTSSPRVIHAAFYGAVILIAMDAHLLLGDVRYLPPLLGSQQWCR